MRKTDAGRRLVALREAKEMTAAQLCAAAGLTSSEVSLWESGKRKIPRTDRVHAALGQAFGVPSTTMMSYLAGILEISTLVPQSALDQALALDSRWSAAAIAVARELEARAAQSKAVKLGVADWVRQLDEVERQIDATVKTRWERLMSDEDIFGEEPPRRREKRA